MLGWASAPTPAGTPTYVIDVPDWLRIVTPRDVPISADGFCACAFAAIAAEQVAKRSATARRIHPPEEEGLALCTGGTSSGRQAEPALPLADRPGRRQVVRPSFPCGDHEACAPDGAVGGRRSRRRAACARPHLPLPSAP